MLVKMLTTAAGPDGIYRVGETWDVTADVGLPMVAGRYATALEPVAPETAVLPAIETTLAPPPVRRRKGPEHA